MPLAPGEQTRGRRATTRSARGRRSPSTSRCEGNNDELLYSVGQPVQRRARRRTPRPAQSRGRQRRCGRSGRLGEGDEYTVTGSVSLATVDQLRAAGTDYPAWVVDRYLQLPGDLPERVERKALRSRATPTTPYDQAYAIEQYLRTFPDDFDVDAAPPGRDSVDYFLFDAQRGYFDYHASAMAVMLRTLGVPARVATGYVDRSAAPRAATRTSTS